MNQYQLTRLLLIVFIGSILYITIRNLFYALHYDIKQGLGHSGKFLYSRWAIFNLQSDHSEEHYRRCFSHDMKHEVEDILLRQYSVIQKSPDPICQSLLRLLQSVYVIRSRQSIPLLLPPTFEARVRQWLGQDKQLLQQVHQQSLVHVSAPLTGEYVVYNPVRGRRPMPAPAEPVLAWLEKLADDSQPECDFCSAVNNTASDIFGRHATWSSMRVSNTFKMERFHGMVVTRPPHHHPTNFSCALYTAFVADAVTYAQEMMAAERGLCYPHLAWDTLPKAGASQLHPHIHVLVAPFAYYGYTELIRRAADQHYRSSGLNFFHTLLEVHTALGLVTRHGDAVAIALLAGKGELELMLLSDHPGPDLYSLMYFVTKAYHDSFQQYCYSLVMSWHSSDCGPEGALPTMVRMMARGDCISNTGDYSSFELYQALYRRYDPWTVIRAVEAAVKKYSKS